MRLWCQRSIRLILSRRFQQSATLHGTSSAWTLHNFYGSLYLFRYDEGGWTKKGGGFLADLSSARHTSDSLSGWVHSPHLEKSPHPAGRHPAGSWAADRNRCPSYEGSSPAYPI